MKVLAIVQSWDSNHSSGGFTVGWMNKLAERVDELVVLALEKREETNRRNIKIFSLGKENYRGFGRYIFYLWRWHWLMRKIIKQHRPDIVFTHMTPTFSVLAYPYVCWRRIPIITWFIHPQSSVILKLAHFLSTKVVSATVDSYPYKKDKLLAIGHGIDTDLFFPSNFVSNRVISLIICVGRISIVKDHPTLLKAAKIMKNNFAKPFKILIIGNKEAGRDESYAERLLRLVDILGVGDVVEFKEAVIGEDLRRFYQEASACVNLTKSGSADKVILEAMSCGKPSLMASIAYVNLIGPHKNQLFFSYKNSEELARKLMDILEMSKEQLTIMGDYLREVVVANHSLNQLSEKLAGIFYEEAETKFK